MFLYFSPLIYTAISTTQTNQPTSSKQKLSGENEERRTEEHSQISGYGLKKVGGLLFGQ